MFSGDQFNKAIIDLQRARRNLDLHDCDHEIQGSRFLRYVWNGMAYSNRIFVCDVSGSGNSIHTSSNNGPVSTREPWYWTSKPTQEKLVVYQMSFFGWSLRSRVKVIIIIHSQKRLTNCYWVLFTGYFTLFIGKLKEHKSTTEMIDQSYTLDVYLYI